MRNDWKKTTADDFDGGPQWRRVLGACEIALVGQNPGDTLEQISERRGRHVNRYGGVGTTGSLSALPVAPDGIDPDDFADAVAELLAKFGDGLMANATALCAVQS